MTSFCWNCNQAIVPIDTDANGWQTPSGSLICPGSQDDRHSPKANLDIDLDNLDWSHPVVRNIRSQEIGNAKGLNRREKNESWTEYNTRIQDIANHSTEERLRKLMGIPKLPYIQNPNPRNKKPPFEKDSSMTTLSTVSYCSGCKNKFNSSEGFPRVVDGITLTYCPVCKDDGETFGHQDNLVITAAPAFDLQCDKCGDEVDAGDDNDSDPMSGPGDTCMTCGHGRLVFASQSTEDAYENASMLQADDYSAMTPDVQEETTSLIEAPRSYRAPRKMMREQVNGLDKNGDGIYPKSSKGYFYPEGDFRSHLEQAHDVDAYELMDIEEGYPGGLNQLEHEHNHDKESHDNDWLYTYPHSHPQRKEETDKYVDFRVDPESDYPHLSSKTSSYRSLRNHLVEHHNFRDDWLRGYNEIDLLGIHDQDHKSSAYAVDHEHPTSDYIRGRMISSSKKPRNDIKDV